ncbi:MAG: hypothetical protein AAFZ06_09250 [Pseudomonadota bacterium]
MNKDSGVEAHRFKKTTKKSDARLWLCALKHLINEGLVSRAVELELPSVDQRHRLNPKGLGEVFQGHAARQLKTSTLRLAGGFGAAGHADAFVEPSARAGDEAVGQFLRIGGDVARIRAVAAPPPLQETFGMVANLL